MMFFPFLFHFEARFHLPPSTFDIIRKNSHLNHLKSIHHGSPSSIILIFSANNVIRHLLRKKRTKGERPQCSQNHSANRKECEKAEAKRQMPLWQWQEVEEML